MTRTTKKLSTCNDDSVGTIRLFGVYGGAICFQYRISKIENGQSYFEPVTAVSVKNEDGTYSTQYVVEK